MASPTPSLAGSASSSSTARPSTTTSGDEFLNKYFFTVHGQERPHVMTGIAHADIAAEGVVHNGEADTWSTPTSPAESIGQAPMDIPWVDSRDWPFELLGASSTSMNAEDTVHYGEVDISSTWTSFGNCVFVRLKGRAGRITIHRKAITWPLTSQMHVQRRMHTL